MLQIDAFNLAAVLGYFRPINITSWLSLFSTVWSPNNVGIKARRLKLFVFEKFRTDAVI